MAKTWAEHSATEKNTVLDALAKIYEEAGHPEGVKPPSWGGEYVNIMMAQQKQDKQNPMSITGEVSIDKKEFAADLTTKFKAAAANVSDFGCQITAKIGVGGMFGGVQNATKVFEEEDVEVKHEAGQVLLLDFWATWCPPCQAPMAHNQSMLEEHGAKWGGKVRLIGLSIDGDKETVKKHVESKKWTSVEHYWIRNGKCTSDKEFGIQGVPHVAIVDTTGKIVFKGHPANRKDLVQDFNDLLEGKEITGQGCQPAGAGGGDDDEEGGFKSNVDGDKVEEVVKKFNDLSTEHIQTAATKEAAGGMPRAFCVLVHEAKYDVKAKTLAHNLKNFQVLVGPQAKIDGMKEILKPFAGQEWEVVERTQAI